MKPIHIPQKALEGYLKQWPTPEGPPTYRFAKCWGCGRTLYFGMWHVFFRRKQREAHFCKPCGRLWEI
jgi:hypothetical protein